MFSLDNFIGFLKSKIVKKHIILIIFCFAYDFVDLKLDYVMAFSIRDETAK